MIRDRYPADQVRSFLIPEAMQRTDPTLAVIDPLLDDDVFFEQVKADLSRRFPRSATRGRPSTPVEVILRMLLVRRLYDWSYEETERLVWDSISLRQFCRIGSGPVPDDTTMIRWAGLLRPETLEHLNARVVELACERGGTRGRKLRVDGTVVETTIHHPTDSSLLVDGVRMISRLLGQAREQGTDLPASLTRNRSRGARHLGRAIGEALRKGEAVRVGLYRRLLRIARTTMHQAEQVIDRLAPSDRLRHRLVGIRDLTERVIEQTTRRVLQDDAVPAAEKIVSLTEPHSAILTRRGRSNQTQYGHRVILGESEDGIITTYRVLPGTEAESGQVDEAVTQHERQTGHLPHLVVTDGGFYAPGQTDALEVRGVRRVVIPTPGNNPPARERTRWFRQGRRFRIGIEGRISVCKRNGWLGRCRDHGKPGFDRWIGWGILANNLVAIARHPAAQTAS